MPLDIGKVFDSPGDNVKILYDGNEYLIKHFIMDVGKKKLLQLLTGEGSFEIASIQIGLGGFGRSGSRWKSGNRPNNPTGADNSLETPYMTEAVTLSSSGDLVKEYTASFDIYSTDTYYISEMALLLSDGTVFAKAVVNPCVLPIPTNAIPLTISWSINFA